VSLWNIFRQQPQTKIKVLAREVISKPAITAEEYYAQKYSQDAPSIDDLIKDAHPSRNGLYPHEILMLAYADSKRIKYMKIGSTDVPSFWLYSYGVGEISPILKSLVDRDFLELAEDGETYKTTEKGRKEERDNGYVYYIHRFIKDNNISPWTFNQYLQTVPERMTNYSWKDKLWFWFNNQQMQYAHTRQKGLARNVLFSMAEFRAYEEKYSDALKLLDQVIIEDKREYGDDAAPGLTRLKNKWEKKLKQ